jgi:hypothetical protein
MMVTAREIEKLLAVRHNLDVFVPQCKTGASYGYGLSIMDAWAMKKSWAHPCAFGYEIKVARSDFLKDNKWMAYLDYCNCFSFVCLPGLIAKEELPPNVGLLWVASTGSTLTTKRKAAYRDIQIPDELFRYILMSRVRIDDEKVSNIEHWKAWLADKEEKRDIGVRCSKKLQAVIRGRIANADDENARLQNEIKGVREVQANLLKFGIDATKINQWNRMDLVERAVGVVPPRLIQDMEDCLKSLRAFCGVQTEVGT